MWWLAGISRSVEHEESYLRYVKMTHIWGAALGGSYGADGVERTMFILGQGMNKSIKKRDYR
jgi:hypothetical protein